MNKVAVIGGAGRIPAQLIATLIAGGIDAIPVNGWGPQVTGRRQPDAAPRRARHEASESAQQARIAAAEAKRQRRIERNQKLQEARDD